MSTVNTDFQCFLQKSEDGGSGPASSLGGTGRLVHRAVERPLAELHCPCPLATLASAELPHASLTVESVLDPNFIFTFRRVKVKDTRRQEALDLFFHTQPVHRICWTACGILVPPPGSGPGPSVLGTWRLSHSTTREPCAPFLNDCSGGYSVGYIVEGG